ncbi:MAG: LytR family transcriptional regulator [Spirochaetales bacterium]|nr:MAG: LytR family transcriptional regulator [Spirochaetales bacterium]
MARALVDKSIIFLVIIVLSIVVFGAFMANALRVEPIRKAVEEDRPINTALVLEYYGKPLTTQILMYYPGNARGALLDIPSDTGLILRSLNRVDRIDALYRTGDPGPFLDEVSTLAGTNLDHYIVIDMAGFRDLVDIMDGLTIFLPNRIDTIVEDRRAVLPSGSVTLDGEKMGLYALYQDEERLESENVARRQTIFQALLRRVGERSDYILNAKVFEAIAKRMHTDLKPESLKRLLEEFARMDMDRAVLQRLTGTYRNVEGTTLLFPAWDGQLVKDIVKQTLNALLNAEATAVEDKVFTLEILNGTASRGLAQKTAEIFESFGYEVVSVGNASSQDIEKTSVLDRYGEANAAAMVANVIRCGVVQDGAIGVGSSAPADFVIILGKDFNGRYCVD